MTGKQHLVAGSTLTVLTVTVYENVKYNWTNEPVVDMITNIKDFVIPQNIALIPICIIFLFLGFLSPDCDESKSMLGRYFYVPVEHRTWLHTLWIILMFIGLGFLFKPFFCLAFGYFTHLFVDSPSKCGVCWLYPISKYKHYGHAKIKKGHFVYLYASEPVAWMWCGVLITITVLYIIGVIGLTPIADIVDSIDAAVQGFLGFFIR